MIGSVPIIVFNVLALLLGPTILSGGAPNRKTRAKSAMPGIERGKFEELARAPAEKNCAVSKFLNAEITMDWQSS